MEYSKIKNVRASDLVQTYDITINNNNCFFGNNVLVHNCGYRGEVHVHLFNAGTQDVCIKRGEKIAQVLVVPIWTGSFVEVESLDNTTRGSGGFGSTGL